MNEIPDEGPAARDLQAQFDAASIRAARDQLAADRRRRRLPFGGGRVVTGLASIAVVVLLGGGGAIAARTLIGDDGSRGAGTNPPRSARPVPGSLRVAEVRAADPIERTPPWGVRIYPQAGGATCALAGRVLDGRLGRVRDGRFAELGATAQGACADVNRGHILVTARCDTQVVGGRTALYGVIDREVSRLDLASPSGPFRPIKTAADGSFLVVRSGTFAFHDNRLRVTKIDGTTTMRLQRVRQC